MWTAGGLVSSNLPSSSPSKHAAALSAGRFGGSLGEPHGLLTLLLCWHLCFLLYQLARGGGGWPVCLHSLVITEVMAACAGALLAQEK